MKRGFKNKTLTKFPCLYNFPIIGVDTGEGDQSVHPKTESTSDHYPSFKKSLMDPSLTIEPYVRR